MRTYQVLFDDGQQPLALCAEEARNVLEYNCPEVAWALRWAELQAGRPVRLLVGHLVRLQPGNGQPDDHGQ